MTAPKTGSWLSGPVLPGLFLLVMLAVLLTNAWVVDDAYITFRTVDNFIHGHGLTWNIDERVQVYTHPLWMFVMSFFYFITRELFFTTIVLSAALSLLAFGLVYRMVTRDAPDALWRGGLLVLALLSSKAVMDYASSGLENCLTYVLMALFMVRLKALDPASARAPRSLLLLFLLATFSGLNRLDTILMYGPALLYALYRCRGLGVRRLLAVAGLGVLPLVLWTLFSLIYYGQPFPNTAYAKVLSVEYPASWKFRRGLAYLGNSISWDSASFVLLLLAVGLAARRRDRLGLAMLSGVLLYILFTVVSAASATHMSGRFFAVPYFVAIGLAVALLPGKRSLQALCGVLAVFLLVNPVSSIKFGTPLYRPYQQHVSTIDTKWYCWRDGAALLNWRPGKTMPDHEWYHYGATLRQGTDKVVLGGFRGGEAIGYAGFTAGPGIHMVDRVALSDPLLARLPAYRPARFEDWKSGHFHRPIPMGYMESLELGRNRINDPQIREFYDHVRLITRGRIWSRRRFATIIAMNLGRYDGLLDGARAEIRAHHQ